MLQWCRPGRADVVLVFRFSRAARNAADYHTIKAMLTSRGMDLVSVTETRGDSPAEHLLENVIAAINQFDNEVRAEQSRNGMIQAAREGRWVWPIPMGYKKEGHGKIVLDPAVAPALREAFEHAAAGMTSQQIIEFLESRGVVTRKGTRLSPSHVQRFLKAPFYRGRLVNQKWNIDVPGQWEPLVSEALWNRVQRDQADRSRPELAKKRSKLRPDFPLKRFVRCCHCQHPSTASWSTGRANRRYAYYHCIHCNGFRVKKQQLEEDFVQYLRWLQPAEGVVELWSDVVREVWAERQVATEQGSSQAEQRIREIELRRERLLDLAIDGTIPETAFRERLATLDRQLANAQVAAHEEPKDFPDLEATLTQAGEFLRSADRIWVRAEVAEKVRFQNLVFPEGITYHPKSGFGTAVTASLFSDLGVSGRGGKQMVAHTGFEPVLPA